MLRQVTLQSDTVLIKEQLEGLKVFEVQEEYSVDDGCTSEGCGGSGVGGSSMTGGELQAPMALLNNLTHGRWKVGMPGNRNFTFGMRGNFHSAMAWWFQRRSTGSTVVDCSTSIVVI